MPDSLIQLKHQLLTPSSGKGAAASDDLSGLLSSIAAQSPSSQPIQRELFGNWGSLGRLVGALASETLVRPLLYLTAHIPEADKVQDDLETFLGRPVELFPAGESASGLIDPTSDIACERLRICQTLTGGNQGRTQPVLAASISSLMQPVPARTYLQHASLTIQLGSQANLDRESLLNWLADHGYERIEEIDLVGEFAGRGGIVDIFPPAFSHPVRIEFFGDEIESIRYFNLDTRRSIRTTDRVAIPPCQSGYRPEQQTSFLDYLPANSLILLEESNDIQEAGRLIRSRLTEPETLYPVEEVIKSLARFDTLLINRFQSDPAGAPLNLRSGSVQEFDGRAVDALDQLIATARQPGQQVFFFCEQPAQRQRCIEIVQSMTTGNQQPIPDAFYLPVGLVHQGFSLPHLGLSLVSHHEVFGQHQVSRRVRGVRHVQAIESFTDLEEGDLIVHVNHGIGRFRGLKVMTKEGRQEEFLALEYADNAIIHVPASKIDLIHKYVGSSPGQTKLSKPGSRSWEKLKLKTSAAVEDMAASLIDIQARRQAMPGIDYPADNQWVREFEEAFPYQETPDQLAVIAEIKNDMQKPQPMDRLLCGDVGYGKTELAMRAAFKAADHGKQVAVLVPTTILAAQHYQTFQERMADFPFNIEMLSRFRTAKQVDEIIMKTAAGQVDILIGTHRILSKDIGFKDLGLVIIDEEQRFGVEHKERLKQLRATIDILTLTATPLPRSMHMALLGIRDISSLTTPPLDRRSIVTQVIPYDDASIKQAIQRELARDGQVFFLHNRVQSIETMAQRIAALVPDARIIVAHGQMSKRDLEKRMVDFVEHKADILVSTTIIESGLDIPSANTILINDADRFGLAELHQLRGRVGRYKNRAYAYMLLPRERKVNPNGVKRLKAIEEYSQLGSGFRIALRDLEIRGAGNILGIEQSGHIDAVGYELYCRLLEAAVRRLKGEPAPLVLITHLELNIHNHVPRTYIPSDRQRMEVYRRLVTCRTRADLDLLEHDLTDLFGRPPQAVQDLLELAEIRVLASQLQIRSIVQKEPDLIFSLEKAASVQQIFKDAPGSVRVPDAQTIHLRLGQRYFESTRTLLACLRHFLGKSVKKLGHQAS